MAKQNETKKESNETFINPFEKGVSYPDFLKAVGDNSVSDYCKNKLTAEQIEWLENDLKFYKNK